MSNFSITISANSMVDLFDKLQEAAASTRVERNIEHEIQDTRKEMAERSAREKRTEKEEKTAAKKGRGRPKGSTKIEKKAEPANKFIMDEHANSLKKAEKEVEAGESKAVRTVDLFSAPAPSETVAKKSNGPVPISPQVKNLTKAEFQAAVEKKVSEVGETEGVPLVLNLLKENFGVNSPKDLPSEKYGEFVAALNGKNVVKTTGSNLFGV